MPAILLAIAAAAQEQMHMHMHHGASAAESILYQEASGTSVAPTGEPMPMTMFSTGGWNVMLHGIAFLNDTHQTGFRGRDKDFSTNWAMLMAEHPAAGGAVMVRAVFTPAAAPNGG